LWAVLTAASPLSSVNFDSVIGIALLGFNVPHEYECDSQTMFDMVRVASASHRAKGNDNATTWII
jgi:hypothetical protein